MISVIAVNRNNLEWLELLVKSVRKFTLQAYETIIVDNGSVDGSVAWLKAQDDIRSVFNPENRHHGPGLDQALTLAKGEFVMVLDGDAHLMAQDWDYLMLRAYRSGPNVRLVAAKGGEDPAEPKCKPIHACFQFFERRFFIDHHLSFVAREGHDVGRKNYYDITALGYEVIRIPAGYDHYEADGPPVKFYPGVYGDIYYLEGNPFLYHNWYSGRMWNADIVDDYKRVDFDRHKAILFEQPLVKEILA